MAFMRQVKIKGDDLIDWSKYGFRNRHDAMCVVLDGLLRAPGGIVLGLATLSRFLPSGKPEEPTPGPGPSKEVEP